jgi:hypothetical protein
MDTLSLVVIQLELLEFVAVAATYAAELSF